MCRRLARLRAPPIPARTEHVRVYLLQGARRQRRQRAG